ncbi:hypothetical protein [Microbacterium sp. CPCC 204701]|uniref:hypothetical protein n=1 Tax=Microbacterium sp. CPCC 204701 TaxID=2493084 RepID=UPI000FD7421E|nr:hypothetical protein [Microbacterium sp. CPCC 204701]
MSNTGKLAVAFLGAGGALGLAAIAESPTGRQALIGMIERAGIREALQTVAEKVALELVAAAFGGRPGTISA